MPGAAGGEEQGVGARPKRVNMGTEQKMLPIARWDRLQGQEPLEEGGGHQDLSSISRAGGASVGGCSC